jgi:O-acetyl-ADP-ribose deacetylase (regulator of RNase III)
MGAGIAAKIKDVFPEAYKADINTTRGDKSKLGTCSFAVVDTAEGPLTVVNAYTQFKPGGTGVIVDYDAVRKCMRWIKVHYAGRRIGLPRIGAGLAGGDWKRIRKVIRRELKGEDVTVVEYEPLGESMQLSH